MPSATARILKRSVGWLLAAALALIIAGGGWAYWRVHACLAPLDGTLRVAGLAAPVEVRRDARGVPHLRAQSLEDLLFAQGYVTAEDRLWQMDLSRRAAEGELSEIFGERTLPLDIENRTLGFRQVMERGVEELGPESRRLLQSYQRGVNVFIETHRHRLPIEFLLLRYQPQPWREIDSFSMALNLAKALNTSWHDDLMRERIRKKVAPQLYADLFPDHSLLDEPVAEPDPGGGAVQEPASSADAARWDLPPASADLARKLLSTPPGAMGANWAAQVSGDEGLAGLGSNNWVVSGAHTRSGKPLLANDPHLGHSVPSVWYMIHLKAPGLNISGVSLPGLPLVVIGHNEHIAWGMTNTDPDTQDLYIETFNLRDPNKYLHNGEWVDGEEREEVVKVRGKRDYRFTVKVTRHGPVVSHDADRDLALRWTALQPHALRFPLLKMAQAENWQEFTAALRDFTGPMHNFVYADTEGNIGYYAAGWVPIRRQGDGSVPVPGDSDDYDWTGYIPFEHLPHAHNPSSGQIATANGRVVPDDYAYFITHRWEAPYRTARVFELLRAGGAFTVPDMLHFQTDIRSLEDLWLKQQLVAAAAERPPEGSDAQYALTLVREWDGQARTDSAATLVLEATRRALLERLLKPRLGEQAPLYHWAMSTTFLDNVLTNRETRWLPPGDADFGVTLMRSLEEGVRRLPKDSTAWRWGDAIPLTFHHRLSASLPFFGRYLDTGPFPQAGTQTTVKQTTPTLGPSMRMVVDFSDLDQSVLNITLGESGQVLSPYYRDQFRAWYTGESFPMLFSDAAVSAGAAHQLVLEPAGR